jgi:hypothetical protein
MIAWFLALFGLGNVNIIIITLRQTVTPPAMLGRMNAAARAVMFGLGALGGPVAGFIAAAAGVRDALWASTAAGVVFVLIAMFSPVARLRKMPAAAADPEVAS